MFRIFKVQEVILQGSNAAQKLLILVVGACVFRFVKELLYLCGHECIHALFEISLQKKAKVKA